MMKFSSLVLAGLVLPRLASAFSFASPQAASSFVDISELAERDVYSMEEWAAQCGVQEAEGFELTSYDGNDYYAATQADLPAGSPVLFVPNDMIFSASKSAQEFGQALGEAEYQLASAGLEEKIPLFRVFIKILVEYQKGNESPWFLWLNSLPRFFNNGAAMTYACFDCLPPYAGYLSLQERTNSVNFQKAAKLVPILGEEITSDVHTLKWAYNVATTRAMELNGEKLIAPMADFFNHGTETEVEIGLDEEGNVIVYSTKDVPAGTPLRMSLGDSTNPTPLFARYGFLDDSSPATFCKAMHLRTEMEELGYDFSNLLFYKETGDVSPEVYDIFLYSLLKQDPENQQAFYQAVVNGDEDTKNQYHEHYYPYTLEAIKKHVDDTLAELDNLSAKAMSYDPSTHPRVPVILAHNEFVKQTFLRVKANLDSSM